VIFEQAADRVEDQIGFRTIETRGTQILLNGKFDFFCAGVSMHEGSAFSATGAHTPKRDGTHSAGVGQGVWAATSFAWHTIPTTRTFIRLADRKGLLVWSEVPVYWHIAWDNPATLENAETQLARHGGPVTTIARRWIFWSIVE